ncbi:MAG: type II 3-dehydroquinate dehydratase [Desulfobacterales bacterium]|nr:type II 3-dehydroquinate dehydratase [Desulfobacterales bacterium]
MKAKRKKKRSVLVIHGPNLNMLGQREPDVYGRKTLADIDSQLVERGRRLDIAVETFQSNHEGGIVDKIQAAGGHDGLIINPASYTHTSVAIRDALLLLQIPIVEIHLSNIDKREPFRHKSLIADIVTARMAGFGALGYELALEAIARMLSEESQR